MSGGKGSLIKGSLCVLFFFYSGPMPVTFQNASQIRDICGESRLWGGMHFTAAVESAYQLCDGVGDIAHADVTKLLGDGTYAELIDESKQSYSESLLQGKIVF